MAIYKTAFLLGILACMVTRAALNSTIQNEFFTAEEEHLVTNGWSSSEEAAISGELSVSSESESSEGGRISNNKEEEGKWEKNLRSLVGLGNVMISGSATEHLDDENLNKKVKGVSDVESGGLIQALEGLGQGQNENDAILERLHDLPVFRSRKVEFTGTITDITDSYQKPALPCMTKAVFRSRNEYMLDVPQPGGMPGTPSNCLWVMATPIITAKLRLHCESYGDRIYSTNSNKPAGVKTQSNRAGHPVRRTHQFGNPGYYNYGNINADPCWRRDVLEIYTWSLGQPIRYCGQERYLNADSRYNWMVVSFTKGTYGYSRQSQGFVCSVSMYDAANYPGGNGFIPDVNHFNPLPPNLLPTRPAPRFPTPLTNTVHTSSTPVPRFLNCRCGEENYRMRVTGGQETGLNQYPWMVALVQVNGNLPYCGGSLINNRWVISAAHCVNTTLYIDSQIILGEHDFANMYESSYTIRMNVIVALIHPDYRKDSFDHDVGLLQMDFEVDLERSPAIKPICLPTRPLPSEAVITAKAVGWGLNSFGQQESSRLQEVELNLMAPLVCRNQFPYVADKVKPTTLCTWKRRQDTCIGDSGGAVFIKLGDRSVIYGIIANGPYPCGRPHEPGINTRVIAYMEWIQQQVANAPTCLN